MDLLLEDTAKHNVQLQLPWTNALRYSIGLHKLEPTMLVLGFTKSLRMHYSSVAGSHVTKQGSTLQSGLSDLP